MCAIVRVLIPVLLLSPLLGGPAHAQQDQIPRELALALIPFGANEGGEIIVGKLPPEVAASITLPPGARVLGSFVSLGYAQSVLTLPFAADSAGAFVRRQLLEHGWTATGPLGSRMGGLQFGQRGSLPTVFCKSGTPGVLNLTSQFYGRETLVRLTRNSDVGTCDSDMRGVATGAGFTNYTTLQGESMPLSTLPPLWSPGDPMSSIRACRPPSSGGALPYQAQEQLLRTDLSAQAILDYYGQQMDSAGWKPTATPNEQAVKTWTKAAASGDSAQSVTLTVAKMTTPGCYQIKLQGARGPKP